MNSLAPVRFRQALLFGSLGVIALLTGARVAEYDPSLWPWIIVFAIGTIFLVGPLIWIIRNRIPAEKRENLGYVAAGIVLLCVPIILGIGLLTGGLLFYLDIVVLGGIIGYAVMLVLGRTGIPERFHGKQ